MTPTKPFIDFTIFMGMHADEDRVRIACKNIFVEYMRAGLRMPLDHVGMCDHIVWRNPYAVQEKYYPFMDVLHSTANIERFNYASSSLTHDSRAAVGREDFTGGASYALLCNVVRSVDGMLLTLLPGSIFANVAASNPTFSPSEGVFDKELESLYQASRALVVPIEFLKGVTRWKELFHLL